MSSWQSFFSYDIASGALLRDGLVLVAYIATFYVVTLVYFKRKDILS